MAEYFITESAGAKIAGVRNPVAGEMITLTEKQAEYYLRTGEISTEAPKREEEAKTPSVKGKANVGD